MSVPRPVIGISAYQEPAQWGVWHMPAVLVPEAYVRQVEQAGGVPLIVPPAAAHHPEVLARLDGLILAGGADLSPDLYGEDPHRQTVGLRPDRDVAEMELATQALAHDLPLLGICRGMQLLCVIHGGSLIQHLPDTVNHERHRPELGVFGEHDVTLTDGSLAQEVLGNRALVKSYHHQGVKEAGAMTVSGFADDHSIEAVELPGKRFVLGVLWHPEMGEDPALFDALVAHAQGS